VVACALLALACGEPAHDARCPPGFGSSTAAGAGGSVGAGGGLDVPYSCSGDDCPACANGEKCAPAAERVAGDGCCAYGDALVHLGSATASEAVHVVSDGQLAVLCGGFGASVIDVSSPTSPNYLGSASPRCQRAAFGTSDASGQVFFIAHHGDSWVPSPHLEVWRRNGGQVERLASLTEQGVLYEGMAWSNDRLYVAAHDGGLRIYDTSQGPTPQLLTVLGGLANAWTVEVAGDVAYVADFDAGIRVVDIVDPSAPTLVDTVATSGPPRDLAVDDGRVYAALGGFGVDVFERAADGRLTAVGNVETLGTAQSVAVDGDHLAVAAWSHVALYDSGSLRLVTTEKLGGYPSFEQDLGVAVVGDTVGCSSFHPRKRPFGRWWCATAVTCRCRSAKSRAPTMPSRPVPPRCRFRRGRATSSR
jgi:hypothetical protein